MSNKLAMSLIIGASVAGAVGGLNMVGNSVRALNSKCASTTERLKKFSQTATGGFRRALSTVTGLSSGILGIAQDAISFESAMADVKKVVDFDTPAQFKAMQQDILGLTRTLPMSATELTKIAAAGGQLGIKRQDIKGFTEQIAKMSVAFDMSAEDSGDAMAKLANVYKIPIGEISNLGDAINDLSNSSPAKASEIVRVLGRVGGVAKQFGLTANAATALGGAFIALGKPPEVAGTAINGMLTKLMTADKQGKKFQKALGQMGLSAEQLKANIAKNGEKALVGFLKQLNKMPKKDQMGILTDLFGLEYGDDVAVLAGNVDLLEQNLNRLSGKSYLGSMEKEFQARAATTENNLQLLKNSLTEVGITVGNYLLPVINDVVNAVKPVILQLGQWIENNKETVMWVLKIGGALIGMYATLNFGFGIVGGAITVLLKLHSVAKFLYKGLLLLGKGLLFLGKGALRLIPTFIRLGIAMFANPVGLVIAGIAGLVAVFTYLWNHCEGFRAFWLGLWDGIKTAFSAVTDFFSQAFANLAGHFPWLNNVVSGFSSGFLGIFEGVKNVFGGIADWIGAKVGWIGDAANSVAGSVKKVAGWLGFGDDDEEEKKPSKSTANVAKTVGSSVAPLAKNSQNIPAVNPTAPQAVTNLAATGGRDHFNIEFKPNITVQGQAAQDVASQVQHGMKMSLHEFEQLLDRVMAQRNRRSYA